MTADPEWAAFLRRAEVLSWAALLVLGAALVVVIRAGQVSAALGVATGWLMTAGAAVRLRRLRRREE